MSWVEARDRTLKEWAEIEAGIGQRPAVELVTAINAVSPMCEESRRVAGSGAERCDHCIVFPKGKDCSEVRFRMTEVLLDEEWAEARQIAREYIEAVRRAQPPDEPSRARA